MEIRNTVSVNLNFLLFLRNLSKSCEEPEEENIFPWLPVDRRIFLPPVEFNTRAKALWNEIAACSPDESEDWLCWNKKKFAFGSLFQSGTVPAEITRIFDTWFRLNFHPLTDMVSMQIVGQYGDMLLGCEKKIQKESNISNMILSLVFTDPPCGWAFQGENWLILSCQSAMVNRNRVTECLKQMCFGI